MRASESRSARKDLASSFEKTARREVLMRKLLILGLEKIFKAISSTVTCGPSRNFHEISANDSIAEWIVSCMEKTTKGSHRYHSGSIRKVEQPYSETKFHV